MAFDTTAQSARIGEVNEFASFSEMLDALSEEFPAGGDIQMRLADGWNDEPAYLFMEQVCPTGSEDLWEQEPEQALGEDLYSKVDSTVNRLMEQDALPGYTGGSKFFAVEWKPTVSA